MKKLTALLVLMLTMVLSILPAQAEVERSKLLDAAFSMLEEGNDFVRRYNEMTGAEVTATFVDGCPYFFGGKADDETTLTRLFSRAPLYNKREIWEQTRFYDKGSYYLYGLDCSGFTQYLCKQLGYTIKRTAAQQLSNGSAVTNLQVGDLVFFNNTYSSSLAATHVGIYTGDNQFIHAAAGGVKITDLSDSFYASRYVGARRIF